MGHLIYGIAPAIDIDDRTLRHLHAVIVTKLRRDESFVFSWGEETTVHGDDALGETVGPYGSVWISKAASLYFSFETPLDGPLNPVWLQLLADAAHSTGGLRALPEPTSP